MGIFQEANRSEIRQSIGYNLNDMILVEATSTVDTSSLLATNDLSRGGDERRDGGRHSSKSHNRIFVG